MTNYTLSSLGYFFEHFPAQEIRKNMPKFLKKYKEFSPNALIGLTTFAYRLPIILESARINRKIETIIVGAEPSTIERRKRIGEEFGGFLPSSSFFSMIIKKLVKNDTP